MEHTYTLIFCQNSNKTLFRNIDLQRLTGQKANQHSRSNLESLKRWSAVRLSRVGLD